ncbi:MAG: PIG-L family deacetylase, partial [Candidatus Sumerlaeia bacterium]|nr:PIG-L family deacetylase [Candidatus Sumerlaeia bacterium]
VIITHWKDSIHTDHTACYYITRRARFFATNPHFELDQTLPIGYTRLFYAENWEDPYDYQPDIWIDISSVYNKWLEALKVEALFRGEISSFDYMRYYQGLVNLRGVEVGFAQAETFMLPPISRKAGADLFPLDKPVLIF